MKTTCNVILIHVILIYSKTMKTSACFKTMKSHSAVILHSNITRKTCTILKRKSKPVNKSNVRCDTNCYTLVILRLQPAVLLSLMFHDSNSANR